MRKFTLLLAAFVLGATCIKAQVVSTFESQPLATADTYYVNYTAPGTDVGFSDGLAYFPCVYGSGYWSSGFAYSNMTDSVTSGPDNNYSAKAAAGYGGSQKYVMASCFSPVNIILTGGAMHLPVHGFYATNSTFAYNSMRDGDAFAHKFDSGDFFKITIKGYTGGALTTDSVDFYLADFRAADSASRYMLKTWEWVNLESLGNVDSVQLALFSSDNGSFGMNTPAYFCIDNFTTSEASTAVNSLKANAAKVYPNPATDMLYIDVAYSQEQQVTITDIAGNIVQQFAAHDAHIAINTASLPAGMYTLRLQGKSGVASMKFTKQ